ncbi:MAG: N-acylneuraminate cytidylyltransferase [Haliangiales bacterium]
MIAIIPARGGSKGLARKNVLPLMGRPMLAYTIAAARDAGVFERVVVSSDDAEILDVARQHGAEALPRPPELAQDDSSSLDVVRHVMKQPDAFGVGWFGLLQPTSPLRNAEHVRRALAQLRAAGASACVSVVECEHHPFKALIDDGAGELTPVREYADLVTPRQALPRAFMPNGAIYLRETAGFLASNSLMPPDTIWFSMSVEDSIDVDDQRSFWLLEAIMRHRSGGAGPTPPSTER